MLQILRIIPAAAILATSCVLSSMPKIEAMPTFWNADKLVHVVCFGGLAFWLAFGFCRPVSRWRAGSGLWMWLAPVLFVAVYGAVDEIHQSFTPGRSCSVIDWCADVAGSIIGSYVHLLFISGRNAAARLWRRAAGLG